MISAHLTPVAAIKSIAGHAHYHLNCLATRNLDADLDSLTPPFLVSARILGQDREASRQLTAHGFRKICVHAIFSRPPAARSGGALLEPVGAGEGGLEDLERHAANLNLCEFAFDPRISAPEVIELTGQYISHVLDTPGALVFRLGSGLAVVHIAEDKAVIDLFSVLGARKGTGTALMTGILGWAAGQGLRRVEVMTECENIPALRFYQKCGFILGLSVVSYYYFRERIGSPA